MAGQLPLEYHEAREDSPDTALAKFNLETAKLARFPNRNGSLN